ncbi:MAG: hypothetical protein ACLQG3_14505 [Terracidiphilus sp.]
MSAYLEELRRCKQIIVLRAVLEAGGNQCAAARSTGLGRNTVNRIVHAAGYTPKQLKRMARARAAEKKPPASEPMPMVEERRIA